MSDPRSPRRPKSGTQPAGQRFVTRPAALPPPPQPLAKDRDFADEFPELRPRRTQSVLRVPEAPSPSPAKQPHKQPVPMVRPPIADSAANLMHARTMIQRSAPVRSASAPMSYPSLFERVWYSPPLMILIGAICFVIYIWASAPAETVISGYRAVPGTTASATGSFVGKLLELVAPASTSPFTNLPPVQPGEHSLVGQPTIDAGGI
jgi:hypothetical protein